MLKGAVNTIRKFKPILSLDVNHYEEEYEEVKTFLENMGYKIRILSGSENKPYSIVAYYDNHSVKD